MGTQTNTGIAGKVFKTSTKTVVVKVEQPKQLEDYEPGAAKEQVHEALRRVSQPKKQNG